MLDLAGYKLTFTDEFNARSISQTGAGTTWTDIRSNWRFDANSDIGFGRSSFVDPASGYDPFRVQGGALAITAVPDKTPSGYPGSWESGLITTQGKFSQTYGYFEMRADLADAKGGWDAFWLLPDKPAANPNKLPGWQELDVVEHYGANNNGVYSTIHTTDQTPNIPWQQNRQVYSETAQSSGYHTYGMDWQKDKISFFVDGQFVGSQATPSDMTGPMYLLANLATQEDADAASVPITMKIDYIRAYSKAPGAVAVTQGAVSAPDGHDPGLYGATSTGSATPATPVSTPVTLTIGSGSDKLMLKISEDAYHGDAQYTVSLDGKQVGGTLTAHASHGANQSDTITINGDWAKGSHEVSINFLNDAYDGTASTDRNLYIDSATYNDAAVFGSQISLMSTGAHAFTVQDTSAIPALLSVTTSISFSTDNLAVPIDTQNQSQNRPYFGTVTHDVHSAAGEVYALYDALLGRPADALGLAAWTNAVGHGLTLKDVARQFLSSLEGQAWVGTLDNAAFVEHMYEASLHRHSDVAGLQSWIDTLAQGVSRADVALGFALSPEHLANIQGAFDTGVFVPDANAAAAARLYYGILDRAPDAAGLVGWTSEVQHGTSLTSIAQQFLASREAQVKLLGVSDATFVSSLYSNALGRAPDVSGLEFWMESLQHGASYADVAVQISASSEAQIHLVGKIEAGWNLI
ncbi:DUF4214 domain-containing protein [Methylobacterium sp. WL69]|uniref:DUF4214 domain-containing protein n=1 Tax=Methylobacterium sp. WL69 TaxID=2603893 RepID=UPI0011C98A61|nr:DUF4214 domain-containing protein [Methylobacterium sp. WL69]TXM78379.1 DUF4214 domain-containing protein [Methylobacterium sp. WL69]